MSVMSVAKTVLKAMAPAPLRSWYEDHRRIRFEARLALFARELLARDSTGALGPDPGPARAIELSLAWLARAQDRSASADGGVARHFSICDGWAASYPETTGYIVPTLLREGAGQRASALRERARRMLDWLVSIQLPDGAFQGGMIDARPRVPVTFNTGQILLGLAAGAAEFPGAGYRDAMHRAARWLVETQDADGAWRHFPTPFAAPGEKAYETHVSWGLFEAERIAPDHGYGAAGLRQVAWALSKQQSNGWFADCCLDSPATPLTHTLGYVLRGILEAYRFSREREFLRAADLTGRALLGAADESGRLPGRFDANWRPAASWVCLTGSVQISHCWFMLAQYTGDCRYTRAAQQVNAFVRRTLILDGDPDVVGAVRGSWPITGDYGQYQFLNWAAKFFIDANRKELNPEF